MTDKPARYSREEVGKIATALFTALAMSQTHESDPNYQFDTEKSLDALAFLSAAILERVTTDLTPSTARRAAESFGQQVFQYVRGFRKVYEETGEHALHAFGARETGAVTKQ